MEPVGVWCRHMKHHKAELQRLYVPLVFDDIGGVRLR